LLGLGGLPFVLFTKGGLFLGCSRSPPDRQSFASVTHLHYVNGRLLVQYANGTTYFVHQDHLGSTRLLSNYPTPTIAESDDYYPFGESGSGIIPQRFTSDEHDTETGMDHTLFRQYSSSLGRWTSPDPLSGSIGNPQSLNRYAYVMNNPLTLVDPLGLRCRGQKQCLPTVDGPTDGGDCIIDGIPAPCGLATGSSDVPCPNNVCAGIGPDGRPVYFWASTNGPGSYYTYSGPGALYYSSDQAGAAAGAFSISLSEALQRELGGSVTEDANGVFSYNLSPNPGIPCGPTEDCSITISPVDNAVALWHTHPVPNGLIQFLGDRSAAVPFGSYVTTPIGSSFGTLWTGSWPGGILGQYPAQPDMLDWPQVAPICHVSGASLPGISSCP
jgi:RHS repeat-associated protein